MDPHATTLAPAPRLGMALAAAALLVGCGSSAAGESTSQTGEIVVAAPWPWEARGQLRYGDGLQLAIEEINAGGGVLGQPLRLLRLDDHESIEEGRVVAQGIANRPEVAAVIGHLQSYVTVPAAAVYDLAGTLLLAPSSTDPALTTRGYQRVFRTTFTDSFVGETMAEYAADQGYRRIAIYYVRTPYGRGLANAFEERAVQLGSRIVARAAYEEGADTDARIFDRTLREWKQLEMDAVFLAGTLPGAGTLVQELRRHGIDVPIVAGDALSLPGLMDVGGEATEGTVVASSFHPDEPREEVRRFTAAFRARFGTEPDASAALAYDAVHLLAAALREAGTRDPGVVARALRGLESWSGVTNDFAFSEAGEIRAPRVKRVMVRDGAFRFLDGGDNTVADP